MKRALSTFAFLFLVIGSVWAQKPTRKPARKPAKSALQQPATPVPPPADSASMAALLPPAPPVMTAADSARERARKENARQLRKSLKARSAVAPAQSFNPQTPVEKLDPAERELRARRRREQEQSMMQDALGKKVPAKQEAATPATTRKEEKSPRKE